MGQAELEPLRGRAPFALGDVTWSEPRRRLLRRHVRRGPFEPWHDSEGASRGVRGNAFASSCIHAPRTDRVKISQILEQKLASTSMKPFVRGHSKMA